MPISLYAATIPSWLQIVKAGTGWLEKAANSGIPEDDLITASIIDDMLPLNYQFKSMAVHSAGAIEDVRKGLSTPDMNESPTDFAGLRGKLEWAIRLLEEVTEDEMDGFVGRDMRFEVPRHNFGIDFTADQFLLSLSEPNFYFHATTAYGILRMKGVDVGKLDFLGTLRINA